MQTSDLQVGVKVNLSTVKMLKMGAQDGVLVVPDEAQLKKLKVILKGILQDFVVVCNRYGIDYTLCGGTCLGAIRHQGFIPWDDDIDINMTRSDFDSFREVFEKELGDSYVLCIPGETEGYCLGMPQIRKKGTLYRSHCDFGLSEEMCGVMADIFIYENVPDNVLVRTIYSIGSLALGLICSCRRFYLYKDLYKDMAAGNKEADRVYSLKIALGRLFSFRSMSAWSRTWWNWNGWYKNGHSKYLTLPTARHHCLGEMLPRSVFFPVKKAMFEGIECSIPGDVDAYLTNQYGPDYMTPPPACDRETHSLVELSIESKNESEGSEC